MLKLLLSQNKVQKLRYIWCQMNDVIDKTISFELLYFIQFWVFKYLCLKNENFLVGTVVNLQDVNSFHAPCGL